MTDGRDIDPSIAKLMGEGAAQEASLRAGSRAGSHQVDVWRDDSVEHHSDPAYYNQPLLKQPVWKPYIPLYYFVGGTSGAMLALAAAAELDGAPAFRGFIDRARTLAITGCGVSAALLIADLGKPERFLYMMRVFRPTSPMNMGVWILTSTPPAAMVARMFAGRGGFLGAIGRAAGLLSGISGLALATYTGVLIGTTAIPLWQDSRTLLPALFGASSMIAAASLADFHSATFHSDDPRVARMTRFFGVMGRVGELAAAFAIEKRAREIARVARPLNRGASGFMWKSAAALTGAGLVTLLLPNQTRRKRRIAGVFGAAGSLLMRFAVHQAGVESSKDARASFHYQRSGNSRD